MPINLRTAAAILLLGALTLAPARAAEPPAKELIEFGWDEPSTDFMRHHEAEMDQSPFDGTVFHVLMPSLKDNAGAPESFTWLCWGKQSFTEADLKPALEDLKALHFKHMNQNFLRFNVTPGDVDWFDDFGPVLHNARLAAQVAREGRCPGILFDIETYNAAIFSYPYWQKQHGKDVKPWKEYEAQARKRGEEVAEAFQEGCPDLTIFLTFGFSLPWQQSRGSLPWEHHASTTKPLEQCSYGLLAPFLDGLVEGLKGKTVMVDGYEISYRYKTPEQFAAGYKMMRQDLLPMVSEPRKYDRHLSCGFGLWMDADWRDKGWNVKDFTKNPFTPEQFEQSVRLALQRADKYVWVYTETPRWWTDKGGTADLPEAYANAVRRGVEAVRGGQK